MKGIGLLFLHFRAWFEIKMIKLCLKLNQNIRNSGQVQMEEQLTV